MQIVTNGPVTSNYRTSAISNSPAPVADLNQTDEATESVELNSAAAAAKKPTLVGVGLGAAAGLGLSVMSSFSALGLAGTLVGLAAVGGLIGCSIGVQHEVNAHPEKYPELSKQLRETLEASNH